MVTITGSLGLNPIDGRVILNAHITDMPNSNQMSVYLLTHSGKQIDGVSALGRSIGTADFRPQNIDISTKNPVSGIPEFQLFGISNYTISINHIYSDLKNIKPSDLYIKITIFNTIADIPTTVVTTKYVQAIRLCSKSSFVGKGIITYYSDKAPYSHALQVLQKQTGGTYSLNVDYRNVQQDIPTTDKYIRPDGQPASRVSAQLTDFKNGRLWSRVTVNKHCQVSSTGDITFWVKYPATLNTLTQPTKNNDTNCLMKNPINGECLIHEPSLEDIVIGGVGILILTKIVLKIL